MAACAQDAIDIRGGTTIGVYRVASVGEQAAVLGKERLAIDGRYVVSGRRRYDPRAMAEHESIRHDDKAASRLAPKGVPQDIIGKLNAATVEALADQIVRSRLADLGLEIYPRERQTPEALNALRKADAEKWWPIIKQLGIKPE